jgi:hypothetical protein
VRDWAYRAAVALGMAVLIKYLPLIFAVPILVALLQQRASSVWSVLGRVALGAVTTLAIAALAFGRYWVGWSTFIGVVRSGTPYPAWTLPGVIVSYARRWTSEGTAPELTQWILGSLLLIVVLAFSFRVGTPQQLVRSSVVIALAAFALLPGGWPWYAALPIAILLCLPTVAARLLVLALTIMTRSIAAFGNLQVLGAVPMEDSLDIDGFVGVMAPALICLPVAIWLWLREGSAAVHPRQMKREAESSAS